MRTIHSVLVVLVVVVATGSASADVGGTYDVKFEEVSTNCTHKLAYKPQPLVVKIKGNSLTVDIDLTPLMVGIPQKNGKVSARSKPGNTSIDGMKGVFSVAGKITPEGMLHFVMVGEFSAEGKALCTQSWNVSGSKADPKPPAKKSTDAGEHFESLARFGF